MIIQELNEPVDESTHESIRITMLIFVIASLCMDYMAYNIVAQVAEVMKVVLVALTTRVAAVILEVSIASMKDGTILEMK